MRQINCTLRTDDAVSLLQRRNETGFKGRQSAAGKTQSANHMHVSPARMINRLSLDAHRFGLQKPARCADTVTPDVQQGASAGRGFQARIVFVGPVFFFHSVTKGRSDKTGLADAAFGNHLFDAPAAGMEAIHKGFHQQSSGLLGSGNHLLGLFGAARQRFFAQHVLAGVECFYRPGMMQMVGKRNINGLDFRILQQGIITVIDLLDVIVSGDFFRLRRRTCCQRMRRSVR